MYIMKKLAELGKKAMRERNNASPMSKVDNQWRKNK